MYREQKDSFTLAKIDIERDTFGNRETRSTINASIKSASKIKELLRSKISRKSLQDKDSKYKQPMCKNSLFGTKRNIKAKPLDRNYKLTSNSTIKKIQTSRGNLDTSKNKKY